MQTAAAAEPLPTTGNAPNTAASATPPTQLPYRPRPGDKLGYSREESIRRLDPDMRRFLDGILRIYREPGLLRHRINSLTALGVRATSRRYYKVKYDDQLYDTFVDDFVLADPAIPTWSGMFIYDPRLHDNSVWRAEITLGRGNNSQCADSRAVEGYLDLYLQPALDGYDHLPGRRLWDRHGLFGKPYAEALNKDTPALQLFLANGCLTNVTLGQNYNRSELSDEHIL